MKFDFIIGNPPYQEENENNARQSPIYHLFMDESYKLANGVELITPARFLFNGGQTPKAWNEKMLNDKHFKVVMYQPEASKVFSNAEIKGGVAISYRDSRKDFGAIGVFTEFEELNTILHKIMPFCSETITNICIGAVPYHYTDTLRTEHPEWAELAGESFDLRTNAFDKLSGKIYFEEKPAVNGFVKIYGLYNKKRTAMWINEKYVSYPSNFDKYKLLVSKANGSGKFGETLSQMIVAAPQEGHTQSFISIGSFETESEATCLEKYIKTKFCRCLLSILRTTQDTTPYKWIYVPLQDFSTSSDINWSLPISKIDSQLYQKYSLNDKEIDFIETHVKEME